MNEIDLIKVNFSTSRNELRKELINTFLDEKSGTGKGKLTTRYKYVVKILSDGRKIYLSRPANFNNGFDFTLNVEKTNFNLGLLNKKGKPKRSSTRPTHGNILTDLKNKKEENQKLYTSLANQIELIYKCIPATKTEFNFTSGHSSALILECIKWLFVEQDVTYWNYSGRAMFYNAIKEI